jgi:hypothetical protein
MDRDESVRPCAHWQAMSIVYIGKRSFVNTLHRMASAATVRRLWLLDKPQLRRILFKKRRVGVHDINRSRAMFGEFHRTLARTCKFFGGFYMSVAAFNCILSRVKH